MPLPPVVVALLAAATIADAAPPAAGDSVRASSASSSSLPPAAGGGVATRPAASGPITTPRPASAPPLAPVLVPVPERVALAPLVEPPPPVATPSHSAFAADSLVVEKAAHRLTLYFRGAPVRTYLVALGNPVGDKERLGDRRTPVGVYHIDYRNPQSRFHLALHISYPDAQHAARARAAGWTPGGDLMIHGLPNGQGDVGADHRYDDWTDGCVAVTDEEIEEIWRAVPNGAPIEIKP